MNKIDHIAFAVSSLDHSIPLFEKLLGAPCYKTELVASEKVKTAFFKTGDSKVELLEGTESGSVISTYIDKKGEGMHHIAFLVEDIHAEIIRLRSEGFQFINDIPKMGADNKLICFLHPKSTNGVLVEICQEIKSEL
ncbi:MAG: methylmalonyl-CoA epimerase [Chitinophagia bacterium]